MSSTNNYGKNPIEKILRTPLDRFKHLPDYNFQENYVILNNQDQQQNKLRMHYIDEGEKNSQETVLLLHGEPTWSYLYRNFIPILAEKGFRVIAPDLIGFGKSDKPSKQEDFSYKRKISWLSTFIEQLNLTNITLFCQDWGGLIGLRVVAQLPDRFARVAIANTNLPTGKPKVEPKAFLKWANSTSQKISNWGALLQLSAVQKMSNEVAQAYEAPFPSEEYKSATRVAPKLVPMTDEHEEVNENKQAIQFFSTWKKPFLTLFSDKDPIFAGAGIPQFWQKLVPGAKGQNHTTIKDAGHFLQEDQPEEICKHIINFIHQNQKTIHYEPESKKLFPKL